MLGELDRLVAGGALTVYFVDDNFIANQKAALELLPELVAWQVRHRYPLRFACEATLNLAKSERLLALMREAGFVTVFCGIETPEPEALHAISKDQNLGMPLVEAVHRINAHGMEVVSGIIIGLDTDRPDSAERIIEFIAASRIPLLTINLLYALPRTPLWSRLARAGRILPEGRARASNVDFRLPYETVMAAWRRCIATAYEPAALYARFGHNLEVTYRRRLAFPRSPHRASARNVLLGARLLVRIVWRIGVRGDYRRAFWPLAGRALRAGRIEDLIHVAVVSHHLTAFTAECLTGTGEASFYAPPSPRARAVAG